MLINPPKPLRLSKYSLWAVVLIVLFAFALRAVVVFDRAANDPNFYELPLGSDQLTYINQVTGLEAGTFPTEPFYFQPGIVYYFALIRLFSGPDLGVIRLMLAFMGALACGMMVGIGWLVTRREWGGYFAGLLLALYPIANFYASSLLIEGAAIIYLTAFLLLVLWQREGLSLWRSALIGLSVGLMVITRSNLALMLLAWLGYLALLRPSFKQLFAHSAITVIFTALVIAPITLWNIQSGDGQFRLVAGTGADQLYIGSNRDASGQVEITMARILTEENTDIQALLNDIERDPIRFFELQLRKIGMFWGNAEIANNLNYVTDGENLSPLLRAIPLDFRILTMTGLLGLVALWFHNKQDFALLSVMIVLIFAGVIIVWTASRIRFPIVIPFVASSSFLAVYLWDVLRKRRWGLVLRQLAIPALIFSLLLLAGDWAVDALPRKRPHLTVPEDVRRLDVVFNDELRLVGWRPVAGHPAAQEYWSERWLHYAVELFWEVTQTTDTDYQTYIAYVVDETRYTGRDYPIGTVSYPPRPTSEWQVGEIYSEILGFKLQDIPYERSGDVRLGVYYVEGEWDETLDGRQVFNVQATSLPNTPGAITLHQLAVYDRYQPAPPYAGEGYTPMGYRFDDHILLHGTRLTQTPNQLLVDFYWEALDSVPTDYTLFVHLWDESGMVQGYDAPPRNGDLLTSNWMPNYPLTDSIALPNPTKAGTYTVYMGLYHTQSGERATVEAQNNLVRLGEFTVR